MTLRITCDACFHLAVTQVCRLVSFIVFECGKRHSLKMLSDTVLVAFPRHGLGPGMAGLADGLRHDYLARKHRQHPRKRAAAPELCSGAPPHFFPGFAHIGTCSDTPRPAPCRASLCQPSGRCRFPRGRLSSEHSSMHAMPRNAIIQAVPPASSRCGDHPWRAWPGSSQPLNRGPAVSPCSGSIRICNVLPVVSLTGSG